LCYICSYEEQQQQQQQHSLFSQATSFVISYEETVY